MVEKRKKILWLAHESNLSGANAAMLEYADALKDDYYFFFILPHEGNMRNEIIQRGYSMIIIPQYNWAYVQKPKFRKRIKIYLRSFIAILKTCIFIKNTEIDLIFTNSQISFTAAISSRIVRKPHVWWIHEFGEEDFGFKIGLGNEKRAYKLMQKSKLIIANSFAVSKKFKSLMPKAAIKYLYQPVTIGNFDKFNKIHVPFLMFGQISPKKGHLNVLKAINKVKYIITKKMTLHIIGPTNDCILLKVLIDFISENKLDDYVKIEIGYFIKEKVIPLYNYLIVASDAEAFGRVIIEAQKMGLKAVVKQTGGAPELINGSNGLLFKSTSELSNILALKLKLPTAKTILVYDEKLEILKLKKWLAQIND